MRIYLIGYMGSGKSTLGKELAGELGLSFIDLDKYIEKKYFKTVPKIFEDEGEASFREKERLCLREVSSFEDVVIATGGGAPCFFDNMDVMNSTGYCVFLDVEYEILAARLFLSKNERPLLRGKKKEDLVLSIGEMMAKRRPFYEKARYIIRGNNITGEEIVSHLEIKGSL